MVGLVALQALLGFRELLVDLLWWVVLPTAILIVIAAWI